LLGGIPSITRNCRLSYPSKPVTSPFFAPSKLSIATLESVRHPPQICPSNLYRAPLICPIAPSKLSVAALESVHHPPQICPSNLHRAPLICTSGPLTYPFCLPSNTILSSCLEPNKQLEYKSKNIPYNLHCLQVSSA